MSQFLHTLMQVWDDGWEEKKKDLLKEEDYAALSKLTAIKQKLATWAKQEALPTEPEVLKEFTELRAIPKVKEWHEMESLLLTTEELTRAGSIQQDKHFL